MIVKTLTLHNFGLYAGDHSIDLSMVSAQKPVILIGGMNGRGKTTLLEAVLLALYGKQSFAFSTSRMTYAAYLKKYISMGEGIHDTYVEIVLQLQQEQPALTIRREWSDTETPITDHLTVSRGGVYDPFLSDNWSSFMETVLPAGVSKFFFFDGEKITELANDQTDDGLKVSIKSLLGIDTIERLLADLNRIVARQEISATPGKQHTELEILLETLKEHNGRRDDLLHRIGELDRELFELIEREKQCRKNLDSQGGSLVEKKQLYRDRRDARKTEYDAFVDGIKKRAAGALPLTLVMPLLSSLKERIRKEQILRQRQALMEEVRGLKRKLNSAIESRSYPAELRQLINELFLPYEETLPPTELGFTASEHTVDQISALLNSLPAELIEMKRRVARIYELEEQIESLSRNIERAENEIEAQHFYDQYRTCVEERTKCEGLHKDLEKELGELNCSIRADEKKVRLLKQTIVKDEQGRLREARMIQYANAGIQVMEIFQEKLQRTKVAQLAQRINERFRMLSEKQNLVETVEIDPSSLSLSLRGFNGEVFSFTKLSAGERQMLVIALLWGLASCLENPLPVIIDTPLARLDSRHRENFVLQYLPQAGQQVIVLSTDEEINGIYAKLLSPYVAGEYLLEYDFKKNKTSIRESYFGR